MKCPNCAVEMIESNLNLNEEDLFIERYFCFQCNTLFECTSQSGDMIEEYLEKLDILKDEIENSKKCWRVKGCPFNSNTSFKYMKCWRDDYSVDQCRIENEENFK